MKPKALLLLALLMIAGSAYGRREVELPDKQLSALDAAMAAAAAYDRRQEQSIDSLKRLAAAIPDAQCEQRVNALARICTRYRQFCPDSAIVYALQCRELSRQSGNQDMQARSHLLMAAALGTGGLFMAASAQLDSIHPASLSPAVRLEYWRVGRQYYSYLKGYAGNVPLYYEQYDRRYRAFEDSLLSKLPASDLLYQFIYSERLVRGGRYREAEQALGHLMSGLPEENNIYGMAAYQMAQTYRHTGNETRYAEFLALAAISDIKGAVREGVALPMLAQWLYEQGELNDAFRYINFALSEANKSNSRMVTVHIASMMPVIDDAYRNKINSSRDELMIYFSLVTLLLLGSGVMLAVLLRQRRKRHAYQAKLARQSKIQDAYIGHFIGLCSSYASKLDNLNNLVSRKLASGQADELLRLMKSGRFTESQNEEFYSLFDHAFLDIYPDFTMRVNKLLRPEEQMEFKQGQGLTPELRIYAFVRLGVEESSRIAKILNYSPSTKALAPSTFRVGPGVYQADDTQPSPRDLRD